MRKDERARAHDHHQHLPPPIGVHHEQPLATTEALKQLFKKDPDYARWVLFRTEELMRRLDALFANNIDPRDSCVKEKVAALLLEAREIEHAIRANRKLRKLFADYI
jgi:hypothetical protein